MPSRQLGAPRGRIGAYRASSLATSQCTRGRRASLGMLGTGMRGGFARFGSDPSATVAGDAKRALAAEVAGIAKRLGATREEWAQAAHNVRVVAEGQS